MGHLETRETYNTGIIGQRGRCSNRDKVQRLNENSDTVGRITEQLVTDSESVWWEMAVQQESMNVQIEYVAAC